MEMDKKVWLEIIHGSKIRPVNSLGQNFLIDDKIGKRIIDAADISASDYVLEIGPGMGMLTSKLVNLECRYTAVEIDKKLEKPLRAYFYSDEKRLIVSDFLKLDYNELLSGGRFPNILISNLPYYAMTPILTRLFLRGKEYDSMVFMVEKAACDRIFAKVGTKSYGPLSIFIKSYGDAKILFEVPSDAFYPRPHTRSAVILCTRRKESPEIPEMFFSLVKTAFSQRRKTLLNALADSIYFQGDKKKTEDFLTKGGFPVGVRAEELDFSRYLNLALLFESSFNSSCASSDNAPVPMIVECER